MSTSLSVSALTAIQIVDVTRVGKGWVVSADGPRRGACQWCGEASTTRHGSYGRSLHDLPAQGALVIIELAITRLKCANQGCASRTFSATVPWIAGRRARRTLRVTELVRLLGHNTGGRTAERLLTCFGMPVSDDTVLLHLNRPSSQRVATAPRVVGIDDWPWRKSHTYGTIMVDLERRTVVDVFGDRSSSGVSAWLGAHPSVEIISRDRHGPYAEGACIGAPQARQVADLSHLVQNLREMIEKQLARLERPLRTLASAATEGVDDRAGCIASVRPNSGRFGRCTTLTARPLRSPRSWGFVAGGSTNGFG